MKWPWVSKVYLEYMEKAHHDEITRLREQSEWLKEELAKALEKRDRIDRVEAGMTEVPHKPKAKRPPMPQELKEYIQSAGTVSTRRSMMSVAYKRNAEGESWEDIVAEVVVPDEPRGRYLDVIDEEPNEQEA
jgi:hypothetical protein